MATQWHEVACETRTIGPLVLTTPVRRRLGFREMVHRHGPIAAPAELAHGLVAELVPQSRLSDPPALDDLPGWAARLAMAALDPEIARTGQVHDDRAGRMLDALYEQRAVIWGARVATAARHSGLDWHRLHADPMAMTCAGLCADQPADAGGPRLEPGDNPAGEWLQQVQRCALAAGAGGLPVWCAVLPGGTGDRTTSAPPCAACSDQARLARFWPWADMLLRGDRQMPTAEHPWTWRRLHWGSIGPLTLPDHHRQTLRDVLAAGHTWPAWPDGATREAAKLPAQRTLSRGLGHTVTGTAPQDPTRDGSVRHLSGHASALASREAARRHSDLPAIAAALQRLQGLVHTDASQTPELITRRVQRKACKKRPAQQYCTRAVGHHADRPTAPLALRSRVNDGQVHRDAAREGGDLRVAGGKAATLSEAERVAEGQGQEKVEHGLRLGHQRCLVPPLFLQTPPRLAALVLLMLVGALGAGRIERQVHRALAALQPPIIGLMPAGRDTWHPTVARLGKVFADDSLVQVTDARGRVVETRLARLQPVHVPILKLIGLPQPAELCAQPVLA